jgi:hypothetical protein
MEQGPFARETTLFPKANALKSTFAERGARATLLFERRP